MTKLEEVALSIWHERAKHFGEPPRPFSPTGGIGFARSRCALSTHPSPTS